MDLYYSIVLAGIIFVTVGFLGCLVWVVLDNKNFYEGLDKQRYEWYNKEEEKPRRAKQC
jgi:hypothetical protein